jgi:hypothetical protein
MRKTTFILASLFLSIQAFAGSGTTSYSTSASFGTSPMCTGNGICGTGESRGGNVSISVTFNYTAATKVLTIVISDQVLNQKGITIFNGANYNFEQDWITPADIATALNSGNPLTIHAGQVGTITDDGTNKTISYTLTP